MHNDLICSRINSMLSMYIDGKLSPIEVEIVEEHLRVCESCKKKYEYLKQLITTLKSAYKQDQNIDEIKSADFKIKEYEYYKQNLSAYLDNELDFEDSVRFKKYIIKIPLARRELQKYFDLQKMLKTNWKNNQKQLNQDFSKIIINELYKDNKLLHTEVWVKVAAVLIMLLTIGGLSVIYYYANYYNQTPPFFVS